MLDERNKNPLPQGAVVGSTKRFTIPDLSKEIDVSETNISLVASQ